MKIGIAGAGLVGRLAAWTLAHQGHEVHVFDPANSAAPSFDGQGAAGFTAAGMLSPTAERDTAERDVADLGWHSIERWEAITTALSQGRDEAPLFARRGSLMVAHGSDAGAARRVLARIEGDAPDQADQAQLDRAPQALSHEALQALEPALHSASGPLHAWLLPGEAHIDTARTLGRLHDDAPGVQWHWGHLATPIKPGSLSIHTQGAADQTLSFDWVIDARGVGAKDACPVRGVRGEVIWLQAPGVDLQRPVRLLHPRYRVYIVPRPGDLILIGASEIESEDRANVSLRSAVELMAAAHSVVPGLAEARILKLDANLRPALPDHRPQCHVEPGLIRINGLYRHGWLLAPAVLDEALEKAGLNPTAS
jgi:glycine oxidase